MGKENRKAVTNVTVLDLRLQIGDTVNLFILKRGILSMVKGIVLDLDRKTKIATIIYKGKTHFRPFKQVERI